VGTRQPDGVAAALAARRAGDEGDLARYSSCHMVSLCLGCLVAYFFTVKPASTGSATPVT
jgi:hypothetical protein